MSNINKIIEVKSDDIDVKKIMEDIQKRAKEKRDKEIIFPDIDKLVQIEECSNEEKENKLSEQDLYAINTNYRVTSYYDFKSSRIFGKVIVFIKKVLRKVLFAIVEVPFQKQTIFNSHVTRHLNSLNSYIKDIESEIKSLKHEQNQNIQQINELLQENIILKEKFKEISEIKNIEEKLNEEITDNKNRIEDMTEAMIDIKKRLFHVEANTRNLNDSNEKLFSLELTNRERIRQFRRTFENKNNIDGKSSLKDVLNNKENKNVDIDYFTFEQLYRGSRKIVKEKQREYLKHFKDKECILDIGCGRGEFLELLIEEGKLNVLGIDINLDMINYCKDNELPVELIDANTYLEQIEDNSLDGVFMAQVVEHLEPSEIINIVQLVYKKLKQSGVFIVETINPQCLSVFAESFYLDITHKNPIHPFTMDFIIKTQGFEHTDITYLSQHPEKIAQIESQNIENIDEVNDSFKKLSQLIYGKQDYAVVAKK